MTYPASMASSAVARASCKAARAVRCAASVSPAPSARATTTEVPIITPMPMPTTTIAAGKVKLSAASSVSPSIDTNHASVTSTAIIANSA